MRIAVCVKFVPIVAKLEFDAATKTLKREGVPGEISAFDVRALLKAVELRAQHGGEVVALTMGPPAAHEGLVECLALGADRAIHLCDRAFAGADTLATARTLAQALRREAYDLILCGRHSIDAETSQVGPELAEILDAPQVTAARTLTVDLTARTLTAEREVDDGFETVVAPLPAVVTAAEDLAPERFPSKADRDAATRKPIEALSAAALAAAPEQIGAAGSPTWVAGLETVASARLGRLVDAPTPAAAAAALATILVDEHGMFTSWRVPEQPAIARIASAPRRTGPANVWVVAEAAHDRLRPVSGELLGRATALARALGTDVTAVALGPGAAQHADALVALGADRVFTADDPRLEPFDPSVHAAVLAAAIRAHAPGIVLVPSTSKGRDLAPRVAARLGLGLTGDCIDLGLDAEGRLLQYKPAFGGSVVAPILSRTTPEMATIRPGVLRPNEADPTRPVRIEPLPLDAALAAAGPPGVRVVARRPLPDAAADLDDAPVVIGVGMGFGSAERLEAIAPLARLLDAALCTTRDVTDAGWLPKQLQVGLTGRSISPKLYLAVGVRGAFEHMVGVRRAGLVVAVNKNARAPIFKHADYGIVGDYAEVIPALHDALAAARSSRR